MKKEVWKTILQVIIAVLTAVGTTARRYQLHVD